MRTVYLDHAATSFPKAPGVGKEMARYIEEIGANINRGAYRSATDAAMLVLETRSQLARLFHFPGSESHVIFTSGATAGLNMILQGFLHPGDHVIVSSMEHNAVMRPLMALKGCGVSFSRIPADAEGLCDASDILPLIRQSTKLVLVNHASNVSGSLFPLEDLAKICQEKQLPLAVDAAQTAGHLSIDFEALHLAALCVPGHKGLLGPQGIGALLLEQEFAKALSPILTGGTGSASDLEEQPSFMPDRFEAGTQNLPGIFGLHAALSYVLERGAEALHLREMRMTAMLLDGLKNLPIRLAGPEDLSRRVGVVSIDFPGMDNAAVAFRLEEEFGILTRCGLHCAPNAHRTLSTFPQGTVRLSVGHTTVEEEIEYTIDTIRRITK